MARSLFDQIPKCRPQVPPQLSRESRAPIFRNEHHQGLAIPGHVAKRFKVLYLCSVCPFVNTGWRSINKLRNNSQIASPPAKSEDLIGYGLAATKQLPSAKLFRALCRLAFCSARHDPPSLPITPPRHPARRYGCGWRSPPPSRKFSRRRSCRCAPLW